MVRLFRQSTSGHGHRAVALHETQSRVTTTNWLVEDDVCTGRYEGGHIILQDIASDSNYEVRKAVFGCHLEIKTRTNKYPKRCSM